MKNAAFQGDYVMEWDCHEGKMIKHETFQHIVKVTI